MESAAAEMLASCETEDQQVLVGHLAPLRTELAEIKETLEHKAAACELLVEHVETQTAAEERMRSVRERLKDDLVTADEMEKLRCDLGETRSQLMQLESRHVEMEAVMDEAGIVVKGREMEAVVDVKDDMEKLVACVEKEDRKLEVCAEIVTIHARLQETDNELIELKEVDAEDIQSLASSLQVLNYVFRYLYSVAGIFILAVFVV